MLVLIGYKRASLLASELASELPLQRCFLEAEVELEAGVELEAEVELEVEVLVEADVVLEAEVLLEVAVLQEVVDRVIVLLCEGVPCSRIIFVKFPKFTLSNGPLVAK